MSSNPSSAKILGLISEDTSSWVLATLVFCAGVVLTALLALANVELYQRQLRQRFELLAAERVSRIQDRLEGQIRRLDGLRRFFVYSDDVSEEEFNGFAHPLLILTQAYSWAPKVPDRERLSFERQVRDSGHADFSIRQLGASQDLAIASVRPVYFPVRFTQSRSTVPLPLGFDVSSEEVRRATLERALRSGSMAASPRMELVGLEGRAPVEHPLHGLDLGRVEAELRRRGRGRQGVDDVARLGLTPEGHQHHVAYVEGPERRGNAVGEGVGQGPGHGHAHVHTLPLAPRPERGA